MSDTSTLRHPDMIVRLKSWRRVTGSGGLFAAAGSLLASVLSLLRFHGVARAVLAGVDVGILGLTIVAARRSFQRSYLAVEGDLVTYTGMFRTRRLFAEHPPARVVLSLVDWGRACGRRSPAWMLINAAGRCELWLNRDAWDADDLERLRARLGMDLETIDDPLPAVEVRKRWPGSIPWAGAHLVFTSCMLLTGILAIAIAITG